MKPRWIALGLAVNLSLSTGALRPALAADPAPVSSPVPSVLAATPTFLMYAEGDRRRPATAGASATGYKILGTAPDGSAIVSYDDGAFTVLQLVTPSLQARTFKTFPRGTATYRGSGGFLAVDPGSQLLRRYDLNGNPVGTPILPVGLSEALGVADVIVVLGAGRLRVYDGGGRLRRDAIMNGNSLVPMPNGRFAVNDLTDSEVRVYTVTLEQTAALRYVGLPARSLASAPDGTLAVLAGTPSCVTSNAEIDVFTDLHAQPVARIHDGITQPQALAVGPDYVYVANAACRGGEDGSITAISRADKSATVMRQVGTPTSLQPFAKQ